MYNVLEKLRAGEPLSEKDKKIHDQGLVSVLKQIHDDLDAAVFAAYGWPTTLTDEEILQRLVALNAERAAEEARGIVRWLRPEFQAPTETARQGELVMEDSPSGATGSASADPSGAAGSIARGKSTGKASGTQTTGRASGARAAKPAWPKGQAERTRAVQDALAAAPTPVTPEELAKTFTRGSAPQIAAILDALASLGLARKSRGKYTT